MPNLDRMAEKGMRFTEICGTIDLLPTAVGLTEASLPDDPILGIPLYVL